jgi:hypothetical protein
VFLLELVVREEENTRIQPFFPLQESSDTNSWIAFVQKKIICHRTCAVQLGVFTSLAKAMSAVVALDTKVY